MITSALLILIAISAICIRIAVAKGLLIKEPVTYTRSERLGWAFICGIIPALTWFDGGYYRSLILGATIALVVYSIPRPCRYRRNHPSR